MRKYFIIVIYCVLALEFFTSKANAYTTFYCRDSSGKTCIEVKSLGDRGMHKAVKGSYTKVRIERPASYGVPKAKPCSSIKL